MLANEVWTIVVGKEVMKEAITDKKLTFHHCSPSSVLNINLTGSDNFLGSTADTNDPEELWNKLRSRHAATVEAGIIELLTECHLVSIQVGESVSQYVDSVEIFKMLLSTAGKNCDENDRIRNMFRGLS